MVWNIFITWEVVRNTIPPVRPEPSIHPKPPIRPEPSETPNPRHLFFGVRFAPTLIPHRPPRLSPTHPTHHTIAIPYTSRQTHEQSVCNLFYNPTIPPLFLPHVPRTPATPLLLCPLTPGGPSVILTAFFTYHSLRPFPSPPITPSCPTGGQQPRSILPQILFLPILAPPPPEQPLISPLPFPPKRTLPLPLTPKSPRPPRRTTASWVWTLRSWSASSMTSARNSTTRTSSPTTPIPSPRAFLSFMGGGGMCGVGVFFSGSGALVEGGGAISGCVTIVWETSNEEYYDSIPDDTHPSTRLRDIFLVPLLLFQTDSVLGLP